MDIEALLMEKVKQFEDVKRQLGEVSQKIGALTEQQRAIYNQGLEIKGSIDALLAVKAQAAKDLAGSETAKLTLPVGVKPIVAEAPVAPVAAAPAVPAEAPKAAPVALEVQ